MTLFLSASGAESASAASFWVTVAQVTCATSSAARCAEIFLASWVTASSKPSADATNAAKRNTQIRPATARMLTQRGSRLVAGPRVQFAYSGLVRTSLVLDRGGR